MTRTSQTAAAQVKAARDPLEVARECFAWLVTGPKPLSVNGRRISGLPNRLIPLDELRDRLMHRRCPQTARDAAWAELVRRSRRQGATWTLACVGMALPALTSAAGWLAARYPDQDVFDVQAEVLTGYLNALPTIDVERPQLPVRLRWAAFRAGLAALSGALNAPMPVPPGFRSAAPRPPWGHPDLVLGRAVREGVLTRTEADLIGATRLEDVAVDRWAREHQSSVQSAYKARGRAERRLADYLAKGSGSVDPSDPVAAHVADRLTRRESPSGTRSRPGGLSRSVGTATDVAEGSCAGENKKVQGLLSKNGPKSGLSIRGRRTPASPETPPSSEVPRCA
ncbi:hypothetical protein [Streptomyces sp. NPDC127098]|uniref:hypothetical protein n=1 Tax=Streptomyces sp. NPDC127098 TaxID=3347137 RepID=UPI003653CFEC